MRDNNIGKAFGAIEDELIASMIRNMRRHKVEEVDEKKQWSMWQAEQLKYLEKYKRDNQKKYRQQFEDINDKIEELIRIARDEGEMNQEISILNAIKNGFKAKRISKGAAAEFFKLNERKLEALIKSTMDDMKKAETAVLRMVNDQYRKVIYNAQVYANTGAGTYEKAVDMATKDFLFAGINCIQYSNGSRHTISDYADMAIRTASKRAYLQGEGQKRQEWGIHTVIVNKRGNPCPKCLPFVGKVLIDDVWSGGSRKDGKYPLMSSAIAAGLYHPRCKDSHTTYFPGISTADDTWTKEELEEIGLGYQEEQRQQYTSRQADKYGRLTKYSLDQENKEKYSVKQDEWKASQQNLEETITKRNDDYQERIKQRRAAYRKKNQNKITNIFGEEIVFDEKMSDPKWKESKEMILKLTEQYKTRLRTVGPGAHQAAGSVDLGGNMKLSSKQVSNAIHEFAHSISINALTKYKVIDDSEFWKEIKKIRTKYRKAEKIDLEKYRISSYADIRDNIDEFFAEAFTHAKMKELGLKIPDKYGVDFTYSQQVLDVTDKFFRKSVAKDYVSGIIKEKGNTLKMDLQLFAEKDIKNQESGSLKRAIRKYQTRIEEHEAKIKDPKAVYPEWDSYDQRYKDGLRRHWNKEIRNFKQSIQDRVDELKKRGDYND